VGGKAGKQESGKSGKSEENLQNPKKSAGYFQNGTQKKNSRFHFS